MPTLAPPPPVTITPAPSQETDASSVSFFGRSLAEYTQFLGLDVAALRGRDVLDVAAGPSSFTAEACARKINAVAVDPLYGHPLERLGREVERDYARAFTGTRTRRRTSRFKSCVTLEAAESDRRGAAQRFLTDYETHFIHNRYVTGSLPQLPFFDGTFDLVLCAHLLFSNPQRFDYDWHLAACRELVRVSADEVRIHPLCDAEGKPYPGAARLRRELREGGISASVRALEYEADAGANSMLVLRRSVP